MMRKKMKKSDIFGKLLRRRKESDGSNPPSGSKPLGGCVQSTSFAKSIADCRLWTADLIIQSILKLNIIMPETLYS